LEIAKKIIAVLCLIVAGILAISFVVMFQTLIADAASVFDAEVSLAYALGKLAFYFVLAGLIFFFAYVGKKLIG